MAICALTSLVQWIEKFEVQSYRFCLPHSFHISLKVVMYLSRKNMNDQGSKPVLENIRVRASNAEYLLEELIVYDRPKIREAYLIAAEDIYIMSTSLLVSHGPELLNSLIRSFDLLSVIIWGLTYRDSRHFAMQIYDHSAIADSFCRVWLTVSSGDRVCDMLQRLLRSVSELLLGVEASSFKPVSQLSNKELCDCIYALLEGKRYLIVIDNLRSSRTWDDIKSSFPDNKNGSKILSTTFVGVEKNIIDQSVHPSLVKLRPSVVDLEIIKLDILLCLQDSATAVNIVAKYLSTIDPTVDSWLRVQRSLKKGVKLISKGDPIVVGALPELEVSEEIDPIYLKEVNLYPKNFLETKVDQLENFNDLRADVDKETYISSMGLDEQLESLLSELVQSSPQLEILAIVGMAGIGKTTLAKRIFYDQEVSYHFDIRAWVHISQVYHKRDIVLQLLRCVIHSTTTDSNFHGKDEDDLEEMLYKGLKRRRYLIVMDDMWSNNAWTELKRIFPDDKTGSRVLWTSRQNIAVEGPDCQLVHQMCLLSEDKSWELLHKKVFGEDPCPPGLVDTGKQIAINCKGLPLAIVVIAGVLLETNKTLVSFKRVAESVSSILFSNQNHCQAIFSLSYEHLPHHLKSCFLYMGAFQEGYEIQVKTLIRLWIAEGFILQDGQKSLEDFAEHIILHDGQKSVEDVAEGYLHSLVKRNLVLVGKRRSNDKVKTCFLHDLLLEFCIQEAQKEKFMYVVKDFSEVHSDGRIDKRGRFSFHCQTYGDIHLATSKSLATSALFFKGCSSVVPDILLYYFDFKLLKVLDIISLQCDTFLVEQVSKFLLLRYLAFTASFELPSIIFHLRRLETLIVNGPWFSSDKISALPSEFWSSTSLRHLQLSVANNLFPPENFPAQHLRFLQSISKLTLASCTRETFSHIPNVIELGVCETHEDMLTGGLWDIFFRDLVLLSRLETLKVSCFGRDNTRMLPVPKNNAFPQSLKKLTLWRSHLPWEAMALLGELPNLEVMKLRNYAFQGPEWKSEEGGFPRLKYLMIEETDLEVWYLQDCHFPCLQRLILKFCNKLKELPNEVGDICALKQIELHFCSASAEQSAKEIQEEQLKEYCNNIDVFIKTYRASSSVSLQELDQ